MTDNEIIKALECCFIMGCCDGCPQVRKTKCLEKAATAALNLINRQKAEIEEKRETSFYLAQKVNEKDAEIERLKEAHEKEYLEHTDTLSRQLDVVSEQKELIERIYNEAIKEFAERLKAHSPKIGMMSLTKEGISTYVPVSEIDNLVKEMTEDV